MAALGPTARSVWERLIALDVASCHVATAKIGNTVAEDLFHSMRQQAEEHGQPVFQELTQSHRVRLEQLRVKGERSIQARRRAIERIGLPQVRGHRMRELEKEKTAWAERLRTQDAILPELTLLLMLRVAPAVGA